MLTQLSAHITSPAVSWSEGWADRCSSSQTGSFDSVAFKMRGERELVKPVRWAFALLINLKPCADFVLNHPFTSYRWPLVWIYFTLTLRATVCVSIAGLNSTFVGLDNAEHPLMCRSYLQTIKEDICFLRHRANKNLFSRLASLGKLVLPKNPHQCLFPSFKKSKICKASSKNSEDSYSFRMSKWEAVKFKHLEDVIRNTADPHASPACIAFLQ